MVGGAIGSPPSGFVTLTPFSMLEPTSPVTSTVSVRSTVCPDATSTVQLTVLPSTFVASGELDTYARPSGSASTISMFFASPLPEFVTVMVYGIWLPFATEVASVVFVTESRGLSSTTGACETEVCTGSLTSAEPPCTAVAMFTRVPVLD